MAYSMKCVKLNAPDEWNDTRGPDLVRWITDADLRFAGIENVYRLPAGGITGALSSAHWVIFHGLQVIKIIPDEVHNGWHYDYMDENEEFGSAWEISNSQWIKMFAPRHLENQSHFLIRFYDDVIEVICKELLFGVAPFNLASAIDSNPQMAYPYLQLALSLEKLGDGKGAIKNFRKYISLTPESDSKDYAKKCLERFF